MDREIFFVNIAAFAVSLERMVHPELRARPMVISPLGTSRAVVITLSREAWEWGVRRGMLLAKAKRYCREVTVLPPNEPLYERASKAVYGVLQAFSPVLEPSGHGHAYVDITGTRRLLGPPRDAAWRAQNEIRQRLRLEASVGVAANKMVSRIAASLTRPADLSDVPAGGERSFLSPLPVRLLPGVGPRVQEQLEELNVQVIRELAGMDVQHLRLAFGNSGVQLHQRALGIDNTPVYPPVAVPAIRRETVLPEDSNDIALLRRFFTELCRWVGHRLRAEKQRAARMTLRVRYSDYREDIGRESLSPPTQSDAILCARGSALLERILSRRTRVRSLSLQVTDLTAGPTQLELFTDPAAERHRRLESALDLLRQKEATHYTKHTRENSWNSYQVL
jgi:DNA polymerase IV